MNFKTSVSCLVISRLLIFGAIAIMISGQECVDQVGSLAHDAARVIADHTFIFTGSEYIVTCEGTVIAWEFCYRTEDTVTPMTFYPGIWLPIKNNDNDTTGFTLVQSNTVTFTPTPQVENEEFSCLTFNLLEADKFTAPAGSVVGLYTNITRFGAGLLRTNLIDAPLMLVNSYRFSGNHSMVNATIGNSRYNISLRVHLAQCLAPTNGKLYCPQGPENTCTFSCDTGYELRGPKNGTCLANRSWSGGDPICVALNCSTSPPLNNSRIRSSCDTQYQSTCTTVCVDGYTGEGGSYTCVVTDEDTNTVGWNGSTSCQRVCASLSDPENGGVACPSNTSVFQDTCTYYCNRGYQLEGNRQTICTGDGTWSSESVTCTILTCDDPEVEIANSQSVGVCDVTYGSSCSLNCSSGFSASGNGEHVCDNVNDEGTAVKWRSVGGTFSCTTIGTSTNSNSGSGSAVPIVLGSVGGAVVFINILVCALILFIRISCKKRSHTYDNRRIEVIETELNLDTNMTINPSYNIAKQSRKVEDQYDYISNKFVLEDIMQNKVMEFNPTFGRVHGSKAAIAYVVTDDSTIQSNHLYSSASVEEVKEDEDEDGYVKTNAPNTQQPAAGYLELVGPVTKEEESNTSNLPVVVNTHT